MKITLILGSIREGRKSNRIAIYLYNLLQAQEGIDPFLLDLQDTPLPAYSYKWSKVENPDPNLPAVGKIIHDSDALIFISPEYHGSYTGVLKNAVDHYWAEFNKKVIGVVATGSGKMGGINASTEMQQLILSIGAYPIPKKLLIPFIQNSFTEEGTPTDEKVEKECEKFLNEFLWLASAVTVAKSRAKVI